MSVTMFGLVFRQHTGVSRVSLHLSGDIQGALSSLPPASLPPSCLSSPSLFGSCFLVRIQLLLNARLSGLEPAVGFAACALWGCRKGLALPMAYLPLPSRPGTGLTVEPSVRCMLGHPHGELLVCSPALAGGACWPR